MQRYFFEFHASTQSPIAAEALARIARLYDDRLVHHATIIEMNVESYRRRTIRSGVYRFGPGSWSSHRVMEP